MLNVIINRRVAITPNTNKSYHRFSRSRCRDSFNVGCLRFCSSFNKNGILKNYFYKIVIKKIKNIISTFLKSKYSFIREVIIILSILFFGSIFVMLFIIKFYK